MRVWRCTPRRFLQQAFDGMGAVEASGRWHTRGYPVVYAAENPALAALEVLVNVGTLSRVKNDYAVVPANVPDRLVYTLPTGSLPENWRQYPHPEAGRVLGDKWIREAKHLGLRLPSAVIAGFNVLLNPSHPDFGQVDVDQRAVEYLDPGRAP